MMNPSPKKLPLQYAPMRERRSTHTLLTRFVEEMTEGRLQAARAGRRLLFYAFFGLTGLVFILFVFAYLSQLADGVVSAFHAML